jgi:predicted dehydrogenase
MMAGQRKLGLGIVGLGGAAVNMLPFFRRSAFEIVGVADTDPVVRGRFVEDFPGTRGYGDVDQICA